MSGYGNKNPPWGRNPGGMGGMGPPHLGMFDQNVGGGGMLQQGIPLQQQGMGLAGMAPQGMAPVQGQVTGISYPAPRGVAPGGFLPNILQQQQAAMSVMGNVQTSQQGPGPGQPSQRAFSGTVTKLHDNFGFVDDDVFFQTSVCKGQVPRVNDRVLVEAAFNPNMPFKWNATRVQVITGPGSGGPGGGQGGAQQNQQQGGGPGGQGGPQGGRIGGPGGPGMGGPGGNFQGTNQLGSAFGGDGPHQGGPGGPRGGPDRGGPGGPERASRFDRSMGDMRGGPGGGGPGNMRGGDDSRGGGNDMRGGPMMRGPDMSGGNRGPHGDMGGPRGGDMRGADMRGGDMRGPDLRGGGAEGRGGDAGGPNMRGGHSADRRNNDRQNRSPPRRARPDREQGNDREREKRNDGEREKDSTARSSRKRSRSPSRRSRSPARRSKSRSRSPPRRRARTTPRYNVSVPKISLNFPRSSVMELKKRYHNLYIPSDFFNAHHSWNEAFPTEAPFKVQYATSFNTFSKDLVEPPPGLGPSRWQFDPPDCDYTWVAKVMLLSSPNIDGLYEKTCNLVDSGSREREDLIHPTRALKFLVGLKEKREVMAIGGPWSPSLDGPNPSSDPSTLIKTAIRTCGALTGIDLSGCTQWTKFLQIHYRRQASSSKPARTETVVIFFPDVWSVMPTKLEYDSLVEQYSGACKAKQEGAGKKVAEEEVVEEVETIIEEEEVVEEEAAETGVAEPAKWNTLDPKNMKVGELRDQLAARGQLNKGLKSQLTARLQKCLKAEQEKDEETGTSGEMDEVKEKEGEKSKEDAESSEEVTVVLDERKKEKIASAYKTPSNPCIFVHPNVKAKSGKFDCRTETLSVLLDYRSEDNKEGTFEVSLFAELFNEMLIRDSAFKLYSAIQAAPERPKEEKKEKKEEKEKKDKEEKKEDKEGESSTKEGEGEATAAPGDEEKVEEKREASVEMVEEKEKVMVTKNKDLLLGASYFDLSHCGYIETKDLEDILVPLQLDLSRAEIKKLAAKLATKDQFNYRLLTDGEKDVEETSNATHLDHQDLASLARGFKRFLPSAEPMEGTDSSLVTFRGTVIDVEKLQEKLDKSEKVRAATDSKLIELQKKFSSLKENNERGEKSREKLSGELKDVKKKARGLEDDLAAQTKEAAKYLTALGDVYSKVMPIVKPPKATEVKGTETLPQVNGVNKGADDEEKEEMQATTEEAPK